MIAPYVAKPRKFERMQKNEINPVLNMSLQNFAETQGWGMEN
jgi:hypothetical protein